MRNLLRLSLCCLFGLIVNTVHAAEPIPDKTVVLTFDDAVKSHRTYVAPMLKELGFGATFFITHKWMEDTANFMTWDEVAELHGMGFEIGNHTWSHLDLSMPKAVARLEGELALVNSMLKHVGVPKPVSFAYPGNFFSPEAVQKLDELGYQFARRGMPPEVAYGKIQAAAAFDPNKHHHLLIPTTGDAYPDWTLDFFKQVVVEAKDGNAAVLMFHGVPDKAHPWVHTDPELFAQCMRYLKENEYNVIALRGLAPYLPKTPPNDSLLYMRHPNWNEESLVYPQEVTASRKNMDYWVENMRLYHKYSWQEIEDVLGGYTVLPYMREEVDKKTPAYPKDQLLVKPYPGGRHPRIGFLDGAIDPQRGTKASVFLPWDSQAYIMVDLPEAMWSNLGLTFLAHKHVPTIWDKEHTFIENQDWTIREDGGLENRWKLPNGIEMGTKIMPSSRQVEMMVWLKNGTNEMLTDLRLQNCLLLKGAPSVNLQTLENKRFHQPVVYVKDVQGRCIVTAWEHCHNVWGHQRCPCMHSDSQLPDCPPGETVRARGNIWFVEQEHDIAAEVNQTSWMNNPHRLYW